MTIDIREIRHFHLFGAAGGGAKGFNRGSARVGNMIARFRCIGSIDVDAAACRDFDAHVGAKSTCMDLFDRSQYIAWHGHEPPRGWREATPADVRRASNNERPHIVFLSAPCKGFSGLQSEKRSSSAKYQALNRLTLRGIWLMLEAWADDPPELVIFENVPRIATRGRHLLDQIGALLRHCGYAVAETTHDCGEVGGLAQSRKRVLLVARHLEKVPPFLYQPAVKPLKAVGTVLDRCPLPGDVERAGAMHRIPALQWKTWVRLAFVEAGKDWRSLQRLRVADGVLADFGIAPDAGYRSGVYGVNGWGDHVGVVAGESLPSNGRFSVADPRFDSHGNDYGQYGVRRWDEPTGTVIAVKSPGQGGFAVADPRCPKTKHNNCFRVVSFDAPAGTITTGGHPSAGGQSVADPRALTGFAGKGKYKITPYDAPAGTVISGSTTGQGAFAVAESETTNEAEAA